MADQATGAISGWLRAQRLAAVRPFIDGAVLDFGCGVGHLAAMCRPDGYLGVDRDDESIALARRTYAEHEFSTMLPDAGRFDVIAMLALIEHVPDPQQTLSTLKPLLASSGRFVVTTPHRRFEWAHVLGSKVGLCSPEAEDEHETLFDRSLMTGVADQVGLAVIEYRRFLCGMNQLFVLGRR